MSMVLKLNDRLSSKMMIMTFYILTCFYIIFCWLSVSIAFKYNLCVYFALFLDDFDLPC